MKERFDTEGLSIPFPQRDVHIIPGGDALQPAARATETASGPPARGAAVPAE